VDAVLFGLLAEGVQKYLRGVLETTVPDRGREPSGASGTASRAGAEACRLAAAWRALLRQHEPGADGYCVTCGRGRRWTTRARSAARVRSAGGAGGTAPWGRFWSLSWGLLRGFLWRSLWGWLPVRRPTELCTVWQIAVAYFIRRLPGGQR
jgi:hypothetical protein